MQHDYRHSTCVGRSLYFSAGYRACPSCTWLDWTAMTHHSRFHSVRHVATELIRPQSGGLCHLVCHSATCIWEFTTSMSCDSVNCTVSCGLEQSLIDDTVEQWQMRLRACVCAIGGNFEHTLLLSICFLCIWWTLCFTPCLMQHVIF